MADISKIQLPNGNLYNLRDDEAARVLLKKVESSNLIHIEDAAEKPLKDCKISINPVQDLHGYSNPWPDGGSKNKLPLTVDAIKNVNISGGTWSGNSFMTNGVTYTINADKNGNVNGITINGTATSNSFFYLTKDYTFPDGTYILSGCPSDGNVNTYCQYAYTGTAYFDSGNGVTVQISSQTANVIIRVMNGITVSNIVFKPMFRLSSETDDTYVPYSNICPISGWTGAKITRTGKNLLNLKGTTNEGNGVVTTYDFDSGTVTINGTTTAYVGRTCGTVKMKKGITYWLSGAVDSAHRLLLYTNTTIAMDYGNGISYTPSEDLDVNVYVGINAGVVCDNVIYHPMVSVLPNMEFSTYTGQTVELQFPSEAGTVYGGTLDVTNGELVVDRAIDTITGDSSWYGFNTGTGNSSAAVQLANYQNVVFVEGSSSRNGAISSTGREAQNYWVNARQNEIPNDGDMCFAYSQTGQLRVHRTDVSTITDLSAFKTNFPSTQIVYKLATPLIYHLTPQEITTLLGTNNIWTDTGNISCTYYVQSDLNTELNDYVKNTDLNDYVTRTDYATSELGGVVKVGAGLQISDGTISTFPAASSGIKTGTGTNAPIVPTKQHESTFYGLAKAAGADMASSNNAVGTYTDAAKGAIQNMLGINNMIAPIQTNTLAIQAYGINDLFWYNGKLYKATAVIAQNGNIIVGTNCTETKLTDNYIRNDQLPVASTSTAGIVQLNDTLDSTSVTQAATANALGEVYKKTGTINSIQGTNFVHVEDAAEMPLKKLKVNLNSYQDLHGYDHPWPAGGGVNMLPPYGSASETKYGITLTNNNGEYTLNGTATSRASFDIPIDWASGDTYTLAFLNPSGNGSVAIYLMSGQYTVDVNIAASPANTTQTFTLANTLYNARITVAGGTTLSNFKISPVIVKGSTAPTTFTPYSNICPIIGQTSVVAHRTGKNLLPTGMYQNGTTRVEFGGENYNEIYLNAGTYVLSCKLSNGATGKLYRKKRDGSNISCNGPFTIDEGYYHFWIYKADGIDIANVANPQLEPGSTATTYEPYISQTVEANLGKNLCNWKVNTTSSSLSMNLKSGIYTISAQQTLESGNWYFRFTDNNNTYIADTSVVGLNFFGYSTSTNWFYGGSDRQNVTFTVPNNCILVEIAKLNTNGTINAQLEYGSIATSYVPYTDLGPIYGGTLDLATGELVVNRKYVSLNDPDKWQDVSATSTTIDYLYNIAMSDRKKYSNSYDGLMCSYARVNSSQAQNTARWAGAISEYFGLKGLSLTLDKIKSDASAGKINICYELATPITYHLTLQQITTLLGTNNIWVEGKNVQCTYYINSDINAQLKDYVKSDTLYENQIKPIETHTYTNIIGTDNNNRYAGFFFAKVNSENYTDVWHVKMKITVTVPGQVNYNLSTITEMWGTESSFLSYKNQNTIKNTSYRPMSYLSLFRPTQTGFQNGCRHWLGINLTSSVNPTNTSYKRTCVVEVLDCENCTVELTDNVITPDNIPNRAIHTDWYASTNTDFINFDCYTQGLRETGDDNSTTISRLNNNYAYYTAVNALYRYQLVFTVAENSITPLNTVNNTIAATKTMLTNVEFDPFGRIYYYDSATNIAANKLVNNAGLTFMYDLIDLRYTFNLVSDTATSTAMHLDSNKNVYLKVIPLENGKCKIVSAIPLVQELPTTQDGYWYILLGRQYDWYRMTLLADHPVYQYYDGTIVEHKPITKQVHDLEKRTNIDKTIEKTSIIHIEDAAARPLKQCIVDINPVQDLHGYENPWPAGGGVNKFAIGDAIGVIPGAAYGLTVTLDPNTEIIRIYGTATWAAAGGKTFRIISTKSGSYYGDAPKTQDYSGLQLKVFVVNKTNSITSVNNITYNNNEGTITLYAETTADTNVDLSIRICISETTQTTWTPYANICPITGFTETKVTRTGKNLLKLSDWILDSNSNMSISGDKLIVQQIGYQENKNRYYLPPSNNARILSFHTKTISITDERAWFSVYLDGVLVPSIQDGNSPSSYIRISSVGTEIEITVPIPNGTKTFSIGGWGYAGAIEISNIQLEEGTAATSYEPYTGQTVNMQFPSEAGTIYGGTLNIISGELVVDRAEVDLGTLTFGYNSSYGFYLNRESTSLPGKAKGFDNGTVANVKCSIYQAQTFANVVTGNYPFSVSIGSSFIGIADSRYSDSASFKTAMSGVKLVYELATPLIYYLTPAQIIALLGTNNIWSNIGDISCTYYIDSAFNTELDNYVHKPASTTTGDIIYYSSPSNSQRLPIGELGQVLKVNAEGLPSWSNDNNTNTTYTFTGGTNQFTVKPSNGLAQTVTVAPSLATTSTAGIVQLNNAIDSTSMITAATPSAVKAAYDLAASKTNNTGTVTSVTLSAGAGISITDNNTPITTSGGRTITNTGVTSISSGTANGTINVTTNGNTSAVNVCGLGSAAYTNTTAYATAAQGNKADAAMPKSGGTFTGAVTLAANPTSNLQAATKQYVDNNVSISNTLGTGTQIGQLTINGTTTTLYAPPPTTHTIAVTQSASTPTLQFVMGTQASSTASMTGVLASTTAIANGKIIFYLLPYAATASQQTLTLTYANTGTNTGAIPIYTAGNVRSEVPYPAYTTLILLYYNSRFYIVNNNVGVIS